MRRTKYRIRLQGAFVLAILLLIGAFKLPLRESDELVIAMAEQELVTLEEIVQTKQVVKPPPPPRPPVPVEVPDDEVIDDEDLQLDASLDIAAVLDVPPPPPPAAEEDDFDEEEIFVAVEEQPTIVGGIESLYKYLDYPDMARKAQMEGRVVVRVIVNTDGSPSDPTVLKSAGIVLDKAATEAVMQLRFNPGRQRNRAVRTMMAIPVQFKLS